MQPDGEEGKETEELSETKQDQALLGLYPPFQAQ